MDVVILIISLYSPADSQPIRTQIYFNDKVTLEMCEAQGRLAVKELDKSFRDHAKGYHCFKQHFDLSGISI